MTRFILAAALLPLALAAAPAAPAPAPAKPKDAALPVPAKALVVVQVAGVEKARGRLDALLTAAVPDLAPKLKDQFKEALAEAPGLKGRDLSAITPDARVYFVVTDFEAAPDGPPMAALVPVADYKSFREKLLSFDERKSFRKGADGVDTFEAADKEMFAVDLASKGYVAFGPSKEGVQAFAERFEALTPAAMGGTVGDAFLTADVSVFVNLERVNELFGDKIKQFRQLFQLLLQQGAAMGAGLDKNQLEMVKNLYDGLFQGVEDARGFALGFEFRPQGLNLRIEMSFASDTAASKAFGQEAPSPTTAVNGLPAGMTSYTAGRIGPRLSAALFSMAREYAGEDGDEKVAGLIEKYTELAAAANALGFLQAGSVPGEVIDVDVTPDADALVAARLKVLKALKAGGVFSNVPLKEDPVVKVAAQKAAGFTLNEARFVLDFDAAVKHIPDENLKATTVASMKRFTAEKPTLWFGSDGKRAVQIVAKDWPTAEKLLTAYVEGKGTVGETAAFQAARAQLPADVSLVSLTDVSKLLGILSESIGDIGDSVPGLPIGKLPKLAPVKGDPAFLGAAVVLKSSGVRADLFVPVEAAKVVREAIKPIMDKVAEE